MSAGGFFPHNHMLELIRKFPNLDIYNSWGPTETTIINSVHKITKNDIKILNKGNYPSIGKPDSLMPFFLINDKNEVISKPNEIGEIVVLGNSVTLGYLNADEENDLKYSTYEKKRAFHTGDLAYKDSEENFFMVGRKDSQVKIFGYRVDLNEIEKVLAKLENVYLSIAFVQNLNESNDELWVAIESRNSNFSIFSTKKYLRTQLPHYMVPKRIFILPKIPLNENGKPDINKAKALINKGIIQN
jgi:acyl-CoA synthetase (AMP-forming)/AMP-acid ligase II